MSEFSESYHLRGEQAADAVELLRRAKLKGYVYPPVNGWVTFVADEARFVPDERITAAATRPLLHYVSAEDHGWTFTLFDRNEALCGYSCEWDDEVQFDDEGYSREALTRLGAAVQPELLAAFERQMKPQDIDEVYDAEPSKQFAAAVGLEHYDWLSYEYLARDFEDSPDAHPEVTKVLP